MRFVYMRFVCDPEFATRYDISVCAGGRGISATHVNPLKEGGGGKGVDREASAAFV